MLETLARPLRDLLVDFGIDTLFEQIDKRLGRNVSNVLIICLTILIPIMTVKVMLEMLLSIMMTLEQMGVLPAGQLMREITLYYLVGNIAVFLILAAIFLLFVNVTKRRIVKDLRSDVDAHKEWSKEFNEQLRNKLDKVKDLDQWEKDLSAREGKLAK